VDRGKADARLLIAHAGIIPYVRTMDGGDPAGQIAHRVRVNRDCLISLVNPASATPDISFSSRAINVEDPASVEDPAGSAGYQSLRIGRILHDLPGGGRTTVHLGITALTGKTSGLQPGLVQRGRAEVPVSIRSAPHTPGSPSRLRFQALRRFHGLHPDFGGSALPAPTLTGRTSNDAAGFASCYGPHRRSPLQGF
jgi:hypothetical protein